MSVVNIPAMIECEDRQSAAEFTARMIADALSDDIATNGAASLLVSGGSTPKDMFAALSNLDVSWDKVSIGLVDERSVPADHAASNEGLVREYLLKQKAAVANFVPMFQELEVADRSYAELLPASVLLLGMGADAHTASWFPGAANLQDALEPSLQTVVAIDASSAPVAGEITDRLTLTRSAVAGSKRAILMLFGDEKKSVFAQAMTKDISDAPIRAAVEDLGDRLTTIWAP